MTMHPLAERFASVADAYERGRPEYAPAVVGALMGELDLIPGSPVLDLAAGTGKLTRALLAAGLDVIAVEPQPALREILATHTGPARALDGHAERIPLEGASVAAVTVADAFHWFDRQPALAEIRRVLVPGAGLAVISTAPDWHGASWAHELGTLMHGLRPQHPHFDGPPWQDAIGEAGGWSEAREIRITTAQPTDPERMVDYVSSMSWVAAMEEAERTVILEKVRAIIASGETPAEMPVHFAIGIARLL